MTTEELFEFVAIFTDNGHGNIQLKSVNVILMFYRDDVVTLDDIHRADLSHDRPYHLKKMEYFVKRGFIVDVSVRTRKQYTLTDAFRTELNTVLK